MFNSLSYFVGSGGVNAFNYNWGAPTKNWIFSPPRLVGQAMLHLKNCKGEGLVFIPRWKSAAFYTMIEDFWSSNHVKKSWTFHGKNVFKKGADMLSCVGPEYTGSVELLLLDFNN